MDWAPSLLDLPNHLGAAGLLLGGKIQPCSFDCRDRPPQQSITMLAFDSQTDLKVVVDEEIHRIRQEVDTTLILIASVRKSLSRPHRRDFEGFIEEEVRLARNQIDDGLTLIANVKKRLNRLHPNSANDAGSPVQFLTREVGELLPQLAAVNYPPFHARPSTESVTTPSSTPSSVALPRSMPKFAVRYFQITARELSRVYDLTNTFCHILPAHQLHKRRLLQELGEQDAALGINVQPLDDSFFYTENTRTGLVEDHCTDAASHESQAVPVDSVFRISEDTLNKIHERMNGKWEQLCERITGLPLVKFGWVDRYTGERDHCGRQEEGVQYRWTTVE